MHICRLILVRKTEEKENKCVAKFPSNINRRIVHQASEAHENELDAHFSAF